MIKKLGVLFLCFGLTLGACSCAQLQKLKDANNAAYKPVEIGCVTASTALAGLTTANDVRPFKAQMQQDITNAALRLKKYCVRNTPITGMSLADGVFQDAATYLVTTNAVVKAEGVK